MTRTSILGGGGRERFGVIGLAALIVVSVAVYLALRSSVLESTADRLLPYQMLARTMPSGDQAMFEGLQGQVAEIENVMARTGQWPGADGLRSQPPYRWTYTRDRLLLNYLATPAEDVSAGAWLVMIQEPDPQAPVDRAPNDETHHRLPDGTVLHVTIWTHRFGAQVAPGFVRQPESSGWTQVVRAPVPPVAAPGR